MENLSEIYSQYKQGLFSLALSVLKNSAEAEDAVRELLHLVPDDSLTQTRIRGAWSHTPGIEPYFDGLRKAGLPP